MAAPVEDDATSAKHSSSSSKRNVHIHTVEVTQTDEELTPSTPQGLKPWESAFGRDCGCAIFVPIGFLAIFLAILFTFLFCTPTDFGWAICADRKMKNNGVGYEFNSRQPAPKGSCTRISGNHVSPSRRRWRELGMRHPLGKRIREKVRKGRKLEEMGNFYKAMSSSWVSVKEAKDLIAKLRTSSTSISFKAGGRASYYDEEGCGSYRGRWFGDKPILNSEDCTNPSEIIQLETILDRRSFKANLPPFPVLKMHISLKCIPSSAETESKIPSLHNEFIKNFRSLIPITENELVEDEPAVDPPETYPCPSYQKRYGLEMSTITALLDPLPPYETDP
ncbi:hypothetical protein HK097_010473 [Rhizophlyctis rosea]|uniref:Uncharacterized protein n=1 Tax=Rhizophlyctis rosea TaxID=64517 RepID=A0AAD5SHA9_9FUNG|nr:hypothetical protein HK097_010473 [Rhizophlyctis rosea]